MRLTGGKLTTESEQKLVVPDYTLLREDKPEREFVKLVAEKMLELAKN